MRHAAKILIVGGGAYGTAIACTLASRSVNEIMMLVRSDEQAETINNLRVNKIYLPDFKLPKAVKATTNSQVIQEASIVFLALPANNVIQFVKAHSSLIQSSSIVINLAKGLDEKYLTLDRAFLSVMKDVTFGALKGPNFARSLLTYAPSGMTMAFSHNEKESEERVRKIFSRSNVSLELWKNVTEVEFIKKKKNVFAIVVGVCDAIEENPNTRFLILKKVINEAHKLLVANGFNPGVLLTYAGIGDLLMTAMNDSSRNRTLGLLIGRGFEFATQAAGPVMEGRRTISLLSATLEKDLEDYPILHNLKKLFEQEISAVAFFREIVQ